VLLIEFTLAQQINVALIRNVGKAEAFEVQIAAVNSRTHGPVQFDLLAVLKPDQGAYIEAVLADERQAQCRSLSGKLHLHESKHSNRTNRTFKSQTFGWHSLTEWRVISVAGFSIGIDSSSE